MNLSPDTLTILKNFSNINQSLMFRSGSVLSTISPQQNTLAKATVKEDFPKDFAIYDLNEFLSAVSLFNDPEFDIEDKCVRISDTNGKASIRYYFVPDDSMIVTPPEDTSRMERAIKNAEVTFLLKEDMFTSLLKAASVLGSPEIAVQSDGSEINLVALDTKNLTSNNYSISISEGNGTPFKMIFKVDNLKVLKGSYQVSISSQLLSHFQNTEIDLQYFISLEQTSVYGG